MGLKVDAAQISPLQAFLLTLHECVCGYMRVCVCLCAYICFDCVGSLLHSAVGYALQFGEIAHKRVHYACSSSAKS